MDKREDLNKNLNGIFTISLDFELYWGMKDVISEEKYKKNLEGTPYAISQILKLFNLFDIHATWAVVGFLYFKNQKELLQNLPQNYPQYKDKNIDLYRYVKNHQTLNSENHFAPNIIKTISKLKNQEIATHTFSHFYTLEEGQNRQLFIEDIKAAIKVSHKKPQTIIFPRNQCNKDYLAVLPDLGIRAYRGNENSWMYKSVNFKEKTSLKQKVARSADTYINISSHNSYELKEIAKSKPYNVPASRFLRPYTPKFAFLDKLKLSRIKKDMLYAATNNRLYHLWWHPHNFGIYTDENIKMLEDILDYYSRLKALYNFNSKNIKEVADIADELRDCCKSY